VQYINVAKIISDRSKICDRDADYTGWYEKQGQWALTVKKIVKYFTK